MASRKTSGLGNIATLLTLIYLVAFIISFEAWGLLPLTAALVVVYSRNWIKWRREAAVTVERRAALRRVHDPEAHGYRPKPGDLITFNFSADPDTENLT